MDFFFLMKKYIFLKTRTLEKFSRKNILLPILCMKQKALWIFFFFFNFVYDQSSPWQRKYTVYKFVLY